MNKHLLATFIPLGTNLCFSIAQTHTKGGIYPKPTNGQSKQINKTQLLKHLKNVKITLQRHLKTLYFYMEKALNSIPESPEEAEDEADMIFFFSLSDDLYKNSLALQRKLSELVAPTFNFICNNIKPLTIDEMLLDFHPYTKSTFDKNTIIQLRMLFQSLYFKHYETYRNKNSNTVLSQMSIDEIFELCVQFIFINDTLSPYECRALLHQLDAKINELEQAK